MANNVDGDANYDDFLTNNAYAGAASASLSSRSIYVNIVDPTSWSTSGSYDSSGDWYFSDVCVTTDRTTLPPVVARRRTSGTKTRTVGCTPAKTAGIERRTCTCRQESNIESMYMDIPTKWITP